jgi:hypothetical protein
MIFRLLSLAVLSHTVSGIYFYVPTGGPEKCFGEEAYGDSVIHVSYKHENQHGVTCTMTFLDSKGLVLLQRPLQDKSGSVASLVPAGTKGGQFKICLKCPGSRWSESEPQKFQIKVDVGGRALLDGGENTAKADDVRSVEASARKALERIETLAKDSEYERVTESMWRSESERTNSSVLWMNVFSLIVIVAVAAVQAVSLKHYFKKEKLIF